MNRRFVYIFLLILLLVGGTWLCTARWQAWFGMPAEPEFDDEELEFHFTTFTGDTVPGFYFDGLYWQDLYERDTLSILLLGDVHNQISHEQWESLAAAHPALDAYAQLGDFIERPYLYYEQLLYRQLDGTLFDSLPLMPVPGNHEYIKGLDRVLPDRWYDMFPCPDNGPTDFKGSTYYVDFPRVRFVSIDTNGLERLPHFTRLMTWLRAVIERAHMEDRFVVVQMHHPVYSCGVGRQNLLIRAFLAPILRQADVVFAGHDHGYQRLLPFVNVCSATKSYLHSLNPHADRVGSGCPMYVLLDFYGEHPGDTLRARTFLIDSHALYDEFYVTRSEGESEYCLGEESLPDEIICLPEKYIGRTDSKVRRFENRRDHRKRP